VKANDPPETWRHYRGDPAAGPVQPSYPPPFNVFPGPQAAPEQATAKAVAKEVPAKATATAVAAPPPAKAQVDKNAGLFQTHYAPGQLPVKYKWADPAKAGRWRYEPGYPKNPMKPHPGTLAPKSPAKAAAPAKPPAAPVPASPPDQDWGPAWPGPAVPKAPFPPAPPPAASFPSPSTFPNRWRAINELPKPEFDIQLAALRAEASYICLCCVSW
jgi:molecular chaperone HscA